MKPLVQISLWCASLVWLLTASSEVQAQQQFPNQHGERAQYSAYIEMPKGYISGICILANDNEIIRGSIFNEFGITALDFSYHPRKEKVKLHSVVSMMDKWYIRRVLKHDLKLLMSGLQRGDTTYTNTKHHITYQLTPIDNKQDDKTDDSKR